MEKHIWTQASPISLVKYKKEMSSSLKVPKEEAVKPAYKYYLKFCSEIWKKNIWTQASPISLVKYKKELSSSLKVPKEEAIKPAKIGRLCPRA